MMIFNKKYMVFDPVVIAGKIVIKFYEAKECTSIKNNKPSSYYNFRFISSEYYENISETIKYLREIGYVCLSQFTDQKIDMDSLNPLINLKILLLSKNHKALEKMYFIQNNKIKCYIHYINIYDGNEYILGVKTLENTLDNRMSVEKEEYYLNNDLAYNLSELPMNGFFSQKVDTNGALRR